MNEGNRDEGKLIDTGRNHGTKALKVRRYPYAARISIVL